MTSKALAPFLSYHRDGGVEMRLAQARRGCRTYNHSHSGGSRLSSLKVLVQAELVSIR
jgi:hypothetical protein